LTDPPYSFFSPRKYYARSDRAKASITGLKDLIGFTGLTKVTHTWGDKDISKNYLLEPLVPLALRLYLKILKKVEKEEAKASVPQNHVKF